MGIATFLAMFLGAACLAADPPASKPLKIGFVDLTRALNAYQRRADLEKELKEFHLSLANQDRNNTNAVNKLTQEMEQLALGTPERIALDEKRKAAMKEAEEFRRNSMEQLNKRFATMLGQLYADVVGAVEEIAKEGGYDLIIKDQSAEGEVSTRAEAVLQLSQRVVLYSRPEYDLTGQVIERLNRKYAAEPKK